MLSVRLGLLICFIVVLGALSLHGLAASAATQPRQDGGTSFTGTNSPTYTTTPTSTTATNTTTGSSGGLTSAIFPYVGVVVAVGVAIAIAVPYLGSRQRQTPL
jgi:hypothetical protein